MKNGGSDEGSNAVGEEVEPVAGARRHEKFLHQFGESAIGNADDDGDEQCFFLIVYSVVNELFAIAPKTGEGETGIHAEVRHLVEADEGLGVWKTRTRKPCQDQDDDSAQDSRVTIFSQSFQRIN